MSPHATPAIRTWLITGATRGIGLEIARAALAAGENVVATGRDPDRVTAALGSHDRLLALRLDVCEASEADAAVEAAIARFGRIDVLVNNAGYGQLGMFEEVDARQVERQFATNVFGLMNVSRAVLPVMRAQRSGHIFNLSSIGGAIGFPGGSLYCATKFAVEGFSDSLAQEVQDLGIVVVIVEPGFFRTDFLDEHSVRYGEHRIDDYAEASDALREFYETRNHQQAGDPAKLAANIVTLARHEAPPRRYAAGSDAIGMLRETYRSRREELDRWQTLSLSTDIEAPEETEPVPA